MKEKHNPEYKILFAPFISQEEVTKLLSPYGFIDTAKADNNIQMMSKNPMVREVFADFFVHFLEMLRDSPDPDMTLNNLERFISSIDNPISLFSFFSNNIKALDILIIILSHSQFFSEIIILNPRYFDWLFESRTVGIIKTYNDFQSDIDVMLKSANNFNEKMNVLRIYKHKEIIRIGVNDLLNILPQEEITKQISCLAETLIHSAYLMSKIELEKKYGLPKNDKEEEVSLCVIAMGKLGGMELNYSSDIDIMFIYSDDGETTGIENLSQTKIFCLDFFTKQAELIIKALGENTQESYCFRVDMRLRPEGSRGQLVYSLSAMEKYYITRGETWERQALIKAITVGGDKELGNKFIKIVDPFIYRKYLDYASIQEIKALKNRIEQEVNKKKLSFREVKLGHGGIRDIEFTVQFLQLLHGGEYEILKNQNTLETLQNLLNINILNFEEYEIFHSGYIFLRKIEHRLQIMYEQQVHTLSDNPDEKEKLARKLGYKFSKNKTALQQFEEDYAKNTKSIRRIFEHLFAGLFHSEEAEEIELILNPNPEGTAILNILTRYNFSDIKKTYTNIRLLAECDNLSLYSSRTKQYFANIFPELLKGLKASSNPDKGLNNFERFVQKLGAKSIFYESLKSSPKIIPILTRVFSESMYLSNILIENPEFWDILLEPTFIINFGENKKNINKLFKLIFKEQIQAKNELTKEIILIFNKFKMLGTLLIGLNFYTHNNVIKTTNALSNLAYFIIENIYNEIWYKNELSNNVYLNIFALGKMGGEELNFDSDLDIIFCYNLKTKNNKQGDELWKIHAKICNWIKDFICNLREIYKIDLRLRPMGNSGELTTSEQNCIEYYQNQARTWEKMAFLKTKLCSGDKKSGKIFLDSIKKIIFSSILSTQLKIDIKDIKNMIEENFKNKYIDFKHGIGGLMELEFILHCLVLLNGEKLEKINTTNAIKILRKLKKEKILTNKDYSLLKNAYIFYRRMEMYLRLNLPQEETSILPESFDILSMLAMYMGYKKQEQFKERFVKTTTEVRNIFGTLIYNI